MKLIGGHTPDSWWSIRDSEWFNIGDRFFDVCWSHIRHSHIGHLMALVLILEHQSYMLCSFADCIVFILDSVVRVRAIFLNTFWAAAAAIRRKFILVQCNWATEVPQERYLTSPKPQRMIKLCQVMPGSLPSENQTWQSRISMVRGKEFGGTASGNRSWWCNSPIDNHW